MLATNNKLAADLIQALITVIDDGNCDGVVGRFLGVGNLSREQISALKGLSDKDKDRLIRSGHSLVNITINKRNIAAVCSLLEANKSRDRLIASLVLAHAPQSMLYEYFGTSVSEMARLRRKYGVVEKGGRPPLLTEKEEQTIYAAYKLEVNQFQASCQQYLQAVTCLKIHKQTNIPVGKIYRFIQELDNV